MASNKFWLPTCNQVWLEKPPNAVEAWEHLYRERWDALVLDVILPGKTGLEFLSELERRFPELPTLDLRSRHMPSSSSA